MEHPPCFVAAISFNEKPNTPFMINSVFSISVPRPMPGMFDTMPEVVATFEERLNQTTVLVLSRGGFVPAVPSPQAVEPEQISNWAKDPIASTKFSSYAFLP